MKVSELGEFGLIQAISRLIKESRDECSPAWQQLTIGIGDDAAAWRAEPGITLATTDCLIQSVHFTLDTTGWYELGWKAMAVNLSDIAAMGGRPRYALVALELPAETEVEDVMALYRGLLRLGHEHGVAIVGGDTNSADRVLISLAVTGQSGESLLTRSAARPGEVVAVTGCLGAAAAGWRLLKEKRPATEGDTPLRQAFLTPHPRLAEGELLVSEGVRAAIDISDGLVADLGHICQESGVGALIEVARVPQHPAARRLFGEEALGLALSGGEDYELLFTTSRETCRENSSQGRLSRNHHRPDNRRTLWRGTAGGRKGSAGEYRPAGVAALCHLSLQATAPRRHTG